MSTPRTKALDHSNVVPIHKPSSKPAPIMPKGPAAVKAYQDSVSPAGVAAAAKNNMDAINKKYPGLYKKGK